MAYQQTLALSRARRVAGMGLAEIGCRTRQASAKWIDRLQARVVEPSEVLRRHAPSMAEPDAALQALRNDLPRRFFAGVSPDAIAMIREQFPEARRELLSQADLLLSGHFNLLGYQHLSFGNPIDWHLDPVHGRRAPRLHWSAIDPLDPEHRWRQQGGVGIEPAPMDHAVGAGVRTDRRGALCGRGDRGHERLDRCQPGRHWHQLVEQS